MNVQPMTWLNEQISTTTILSIYNGTLKKISASQSDFLNSVLTRKPAKVDHTFLDKLT